MKIFKNNILRGAALVLATFLMNVASPVQAASQNECAIWLCAPGGFPSPSCDAPKSAMIHRVEHGKSPLPSLAGCTKDGNTGGTTGIADKAIHIGAHTETRAREVGEHTRFYRVAIADHWEVGGSCRIPLGHGEYTRRAYCSGPYHRIRVFVNQKQVGQTYYWR